MASGDTLCVWLAADDEPPAASAPQEVTRNNHPALAFDATVDETTYFSGVMPRHYAGGGVTITVHWMAQSAVSGQTRWQLAMERMTGQDLDADGFAADVGSSATCNATSGIPTATELALTAGAAMDSVVAGDEFRIRVRRDADGSSGTDDMTGDAQLLGVEMRET